MKKRLLFICLALLPLMASAWDACVDGIYYDLKNDAGTQREAFVTYKNTNYNSYSGDIVIPPSIIYNNADYKVTSIGQFAFKNCYSLTSVTIPNGVKIIRNGAFCDCSGLTSVTIPNSVEEIYGEAFYNCSGLTSVTIPARVTYVAVSAFNGCSGLSSIVVDSYNTTYDSRNSCNAIIRTARNALVQGCKNTIIPNSVTYIEGHAFNGCKGLTSINIPSSVTYIGSSAFRDCSGLTSVTIPNNVTSIGEEAFCGCSGLTSITIGNGVTSIGGSAFYGCSGLTSVTIPNSVTSIGQCAFRDCSGLTSVTIGNSVTSIGWGAFKDCSGLTEVTCLAENVPQTGNIVFDGITLSNVTLVVPPESLSSYQNTSPWEDFGKICFKAVMNDFYYVLDTPNEEATIAGPVGSISGSLTIPSYVVCEGVDYDVVAIHDKAFEGYSGLTSITIPNSIISIGTEAFSGCTGLTSISIGKKVKSIGQDAFDGCSGLTSIIVNSGNTVYDSRNNCNAIIETTTGKLILGCNTTVIPDDVTVIGNNAFYNCSGLTSVTIPNSVTSIDDSAFYGCSGLTSVTFGNSVTSIGENAFVGCNSLTSVKISDLAAWCGITFERYANPLINAHHLYMNGEEIKDLVIPDNVTSIGNRAFQGCIGLSSVNIGNSVKNIGIFVFQHCTSLNSVIIGKSVTTIGQDAFNGCSGLTSVVLNSNAIVSADRTQNDNLKNIFGSQVKEYAIGNDVTAIGSYAFYGCNSMTSITIGNKVTTIGDYALYGCSGLSSITIGNKVTSIGIFAFQNCSGLTSVKISDLAAWCKTNFGNIQANPLPYAHHLYLNGQEVKNLEIPNSITAIRDYTFYGCSGLTSVTIPNSVTSIGEYAFTGCYGLTSVTIPNSVTSIGDRAFWACRDLTSVTIGNSVTSIGGAVFRDCNALTSVNINSDAIVSADRTESDNINNIFGNQVKEYIIGNDVTAIGENAFRGNLNLTTVSVGANISSIGDNAFYGCSNMTTFTCYAVDIPTANSSVFEGIDLTGATLYVPASALEDYEDTKPWRRFGTILPIGTIPTAIDTADVEAGDNDKQYYDLSGRRMTSSQRGLRIVRDASGNTRKVLVK